MQYPALQVKIKEQNHFPLITPLTKLAFLPQNHPKYSWKRLGTKGELPTFKVERSARGFPTRKVPISVNMSGWSHSGTIRRPQRVLLQTSCNVRRWILLVNGFLWVPNSSGIRWVEVEISDKPDKALNEPSYLCNFHIEATATTKVVLRRRAGCQNA